MPRKKKPEIVIMALTDADLAPVRARAQAHAQATKQFVREALKKESGEKDRGEVSELSVPQVVAFDLNAAFKKAALVKAQLAGFSDIANLRKTSEGWVFECLTVTQAREAAYRREVEKERGRMGIPAEATP